MGNATPDHPWLKGVPAAETLAQTPQARQLLIAVNAPSQMSKPYAVAPEVPIDRVEALRYAFGQAVADPEFLAEVTRAQLALAPLIGSEVLAQATQVLDLPPEVLGKLKEILK
jgi:hypothetical protein